LEPILTGPLLGEGRAVMSVAHSRVKRANWDRHACATPSLGWRYRPLPTSPGELAEIDRSQLLAGVSRFRAALNSSRGFFGFCRRSQARAERLFADIRGTQRKQNLAKAWGFGGGTVSGGSTRSRASKAPAPAMNLRRFSNGPVSFQAGGALATIGHRCRRCVVTPMYPVQTQEKNHAMYDFDRQSFGTTTARFGTRL
jgi:hypothetical protein